MCVRRRSAARVQCRYDDPPRTVSAPMSLVLALSAASVAGACLPCSKMSMFITAPRSLGRSPMASRMAATACADDEDDAVEDFGPVEAVAAAAFLALSSLLPPTPVRDASAVAVVLVAPVAVALPPDAAVAAAVAAETPLLAAG